MSEYFHVKKPFVDQLAGLGWNVADRRDREKDANSRFAMGIDFVVAFRRQELRPMQYLMSGRVPVRLSATNEVNLL
jgi:hypothetical protein